MLLYVAQSKTASPVIATKETRSDEDISQHSDDAPPAASAGSAAMEHAQHAPKLEVDMQKSQKERTTRGGGRRRGRELLRIRVRVTVPYRTGELGLKDFFCFHE